MRVVIDANIWISATLNPTGYPARLKQLWLEGWFETVVCLELINEVTSVLMRPRIKDKYALSLEEIDLVRRVIEQRSTLEKPVDIEISLRDPKDNYLVGLAIAGKANYIVTRDGDLRGDKNLPALLEGYSIRVLSVNQFLSLFD